MKMEYTCLLVFCLLGNVSLFECSEADDLALRVERLMTSVQQLRETEAGLTSRVQQLTVKALPSNSSSTTARQDTAVFNAHVYESQGFTVVADGTAIPFFSVTLNEGQCTCTPDGQCYNPLFGFFQCPETAVYYFGVSMASPMDHVNYVHIRVVSATLGTPIRLKTFTVDGFGVQSGSHYANMLYRCTAGAQVSVMANSDIGDGSGYVDVVPGTLSSFVGFKI